MENSASLFLLFLPYMTFADWDFLCSSGSLAPMSLNSFMSPRFFWHRNFHVIPSLEINFSSSAHQSLQISSWESLRFELLTSWLSGHNWSESSVLVHQHLIFVEFYSKIHFPHFRSWLYLQVLILVFWMKFMSYFSMTTEILLFCNFGLGPMPKVFLLLEFMFVVIRVLKLFLFH